MHGRHGVGWFNSLMGLGDSFSFRQKPTGAFEWILKAPGPMMTGLPMVAFGGPDQDEG